MEYFLIVPIALLTVATHVLIVATQYHTMATTYAQLRIVYSIVGINTYSSLLMYFTCLPPLGLSGSLWGHTVNLIIFNVACGMCPFIIYNILCQLKDSARVCTQC